jgi:hypothetical protein
MPRGYCVIIGVGVGVGVGAGAAGARGERSVQSDHAFICAEVRGQDRQMESAASSQKSRNHERFMRSNLILVADGRAASLIAGGKFQGPTVLLAPARFVCEGKKR